MKALLAFMLLFVWVTYAVATQCVDCPDPSRPWMRGSIEKYCGTSPEQIEAMKQDRPENADNILLCACQHKCDPLNDRADETGGMAWDAACETRCNPRNCVCEHDCDS